LFPKAPLLLLRLLLLPPPLLLMLLLLLRLLLLLLLLLLPRVVKHALLERRFLFLSHPPEHALARGFV
jgi:hypothetical protein